MRCCCCCDPCALRIQVITQLLAKIRDLVSNLADPACEGVPASRQLTDQHRSAQREIVFSATEFAARLRAREQGAGFARFAVLTDLQEEVTVENASRLVRLSSDLTEVLGILTCRPETSVKLPCAAEAVKESIGAAGGAESLKRGRESLGALAVNVTKTRRRLPTPHHSATAAPSDYSEEEIESEGADEREEAAYFYDKSPPQPDGPPDEEESEEGADEGVVDFLEKCLSPESDFSLSPRR